MNACTARPRRTGAPRVLASVVLMVATCAFEGVSRAEADNAQALFDEAKRLAAANRYGQACPLLERSLAADPALGAMFNLADCYEHVGRLAAAWHMFRRVEAGAHAVGQADREIRAHDRASALDTRVARVTVNVGMGARVQNLRVLRDGEVMAREAWGVPTPVDVGAHEIRAEAPGRTAWRTVVLVPTDGAVRAVEVPVLGALAAEYGAPPAAAAGGARAAGTPHTTALVVGAAGLVVVAAGAVFGSMSLAKHTECDGPCVGSARDRQSDAYVYGNTSTVMFTIGGAALVGAVVLWLVAPRRAAATVSPVRFGRSWITVGP